MKSLWDNYIANQMGYSNRLNMGKLELKRMLRGFVHRYFTNVIDSWGK